MTRIAIFGAGAVGCWIGGRLAAGGAAVTLIGRPRVLAELEHGLRVTELDGATREVKPALATDAAAAKDAEIVLVTVKSAATATAARELAPALASDALIVSLQNGVRNVGELRDGLPERRVLAGMVPYNLIKREPGSYLRASGGTLMFENHHAIAPLTAACERAELAFELREDMQGVQWSKLVLNLNNAINALSGKPLAEELADRDFRGCLAACQREALALIDEAGISLARITPLPTKWIARALTVPDGVFKLLGKRIVAIDPKARSSMWDDLEAKRPTEVDYIQGEIVALAHRLGRRAPICQALVNLIKEAERGGTRVYSGAELYAAITQPTA